MPHSGRMTLFNKDGKEIEAAQYYTAEKRRNIIAKWLNIYNPNGYYQIDLRPPYIRNKLITKPVIPDKQKEPIKRFPAIYDNRKSLYPELNQ
jgi:hypothetical protein